MESIGRMDATLIRKRGGANRWPFVRRKGMRRHWGDRTGAVQMEYVILAVLIAVACGMAVVVLGRAIVASMITASEGTTLRHTDAQESLHKRRQDMQEYSDRARDYHDSFHE